VNPLNGRPIGTIDPVASLVYAQTGHWHLKGFLTDEQQDAFATAARTLKSTAPLVPPTMRDGTAMSVRVSSFGQRGWWADREGYRYINRHPTTKAAFPGMPAVIRDAADQALYAAGRYTGMCLPDFTAADWGLAQGMRSHSLACDTCLVNHYGPGAQLGWHVDQTELDKVSPIVTFSIGATATFEIRLDVGGTMRTFRHRLDSGDAIVMAGPARLGEHRVTDVRVEAQADLFGPATHNPIRAAVGTRLSFTVRRTGYSK
jgi:alkylated DNA repair protein (DNA oxidative demethylase)